MIEVFATDSAFQIAEKIYKHFEVGQSCTVIGYVRDDSLMELFRKGDIVIKEIDALDKADNTTERGYRKNKKPKDSIGGFLAQKIFKFKHLTPEKTAIWRIQ